MLCALPAGWAADPVLAHGGHTRAPNRPRGALAAAFREEHAAALGGPL